MFHRVLLPALITLGPAASVGVAGVVANTSTATWVLCYWEPVQDGDAQTARKITRELRLDPMPSDQVLLTEVDPQRPDWPGFTRTPADLGPLRAITLRPGWELHVRSTRPTAPQAAVFTVHDAIDAQSADFRPMEGFADLVFLAGQGGRGDAVSIEVWTTPFTRGFLDPKAQVKTCIRPAGRGRIEIVADSWGYSRLRKREMSPIASSPPVPSSATQSPSAPTASGRAPAPADLPVSAQAAARAASTVEELPEGPTRPASGWQPPGPSSRAMQAAPERRGLLDRITACMDSLLSCTCDCTCD